MAIAITDLGSNTTIVDVTGGETDVNLLAALQTYILAHGWEDADTASWTSGAYQCRTFKSLCKDGITYKYASLFVDVVSLQIRVSESYDPVTHAFTNLCYYSDGETHDLGYNLANPTSFFIFASNRYLAIKVCGVYPLIGCFEYKPIISDINAPPYIWMNSSYMFYPSTNPSPYYYCFSFPRIYTNTTGVNSSFYNLCMTPVGCWGYNCGTYNSNVIVGTQQLQYGSEVRWPGYDIVLSDRLKYTAHGTAYGLKITAANLGIESNILSVKCNADKFTDPTGTDTDHFIIAGYSTDRILLPL